MAFTSFPPGSPSSVPLGSGATLVFTAVPGAASNVMLQNIGTSVVYLGGSGVTQNTGIALQPSNRSTWFPNVTTSIYGVCTYALGAVAGTIQSSGTAGTSVLTMATTASTTALTVGQVLVVGSTAHTANQEVVTVAATSGTANFTITTTTVFAHDTTNIVFNATLAPSTVKITPGVAP